ncbi:MAG: efflux RND transporter permease subunit [Candidatus Pseudobacter hemicellulosilyticus]|uniref:Efflux RND transporter permease subunit n=1 Tax=Candidatus Pseudobacter hemicellulosilyticus TaxID=3121375 RepID=A0AAJ5WZP3_9BACT|nr:MAG: efflux RND transporter permease subunit [Pseudobacter sp.]
MKRLLSLSLQLRLVVVVVMGLLLVIGSRVIQDASYDVFPEFAPPYVEIQVEAPGLSTAETEALIAVPIENALNGIPWSIHLKSKSVLGLASIRIEFENGTDIIKARQLVQERIGRVAAQLPAIARPPVMLQPLSTTSRVLKIGVSSDKLSQMDMTTQVRWTLRPRLMAVPGVANVAIWGQRDRQLQVQVIPEKLFAHNLTLNQVITAVTDAVRQFGGGFVDMPNQRMAISNLPHIYSAEDLARISLPSKNGTPIPLGEVAEVLEGFPAPIGDAVINDKEGLLLIVEKQPQANTLDVTHHVEKVLTEMKPGFADMQFDSTIFRPATFIEMSLHNLNKALLIGCVLVIIVLFFFLNDWRTALISVLAIPLSLLIAMMVLHYQGGTINTMVLAGLVIALGEVVDDAIIDVENIVRRLRLNSLLPQPLPAYQVVLHASLEVRSAVVYGSIIVALVLMPVFFLPGISGAFFQPLALSYILAILASLFVALTLTPALSLLLLPKKYASRTGKRVKEPALVLWLKPRYERILQGLLARPRRVFAATGLLLVLGIASLPFLGEEFLPHFKEYDFLMHWVEKPGTSLEASKRITVQVSKELRAIPGVRNFGAHIGRAEVADEVVGPNFTENWISISPDVPYDSTIARIQEVVDGYPGLYRDVLTYLRERVKEVLTGTSASIVVRIYGSDLAMLETKAKEVNTALSSVPGIADLKVQPQTLVPQLAVKYNPEKAARFGINATDMRRTINALVNGLKVGEIYEDQKIFDVVVWGTAPQRSDITAIPHLLVDIPTGGRAALKDLADIYVSPTPNEITREAASRRIDVTCNTKGVALGTVAKAIEARLKSISFPPGYHPEILGEYAERQASQRALNMLAIISVLGIFLLLYADFKSYRTATLILLSLPVALLGCILAAWLSGGILSLGSLVGFVTVLGIAARNAIMLISHYRHLQQEENETFSLHLVIKGAMERMSPILMTALAAALALIPIAVTGNQPGQEIEYPMAIIILGGITTSTLLNLFVLPVIFWRFGKAKKEQQQETAGA